MIRVLAVDDHSVFRGGIAALVGHQSDMTLVGEASNGQEAIQQFPAHRPDYLHRRRSGVTGAQGGRSDSPSSGTEAVSP